MTVTVVTEQNFVQASETVEFIITNLQLQMSNNRWKFRHFELAITLVKMTAV